MNAAHGCAVVLACLAIARPVAAGPAESADARRISEFAIEASGLEREGEDIAKLVGSLDKRVRAELAQRSVELGASDAARMRLVLRWLDYDRSDYMGKFEIQRVGADAWTDVASFECFACTNTALTKRVVAELPAAVDALARAESPSGDPPAPRIGPDTGEPPPRGTDPPHTTPEHKLGALGKSGIGVLVLGVASTSVGIGLAATGSTQSQNEYDVTDLRVPGFASLGVGLALVAAGAVMLGIDVARHKKRRAAATPTVGPRTAGLVFTVRF